MTMKLYNYYRSSASYRVRIALGLKGLAYEYVAVNLAGGEQFAPGYAELTAAQAVPMLEDGAARVTQSLAIIEYLDETHPLPPLLPASAEDRARVRALAQTIACDIHPVNNLRVLQYLDKHFAATQEQKDAWYRHWVNAGLLAVEQLLSSHPATGTFCHGETPGLADCCLVPQVFNARRFDCPFDALPTIRRIVTACEALPAFCNAAPAMQPDAE